MQRKHSTDIQLSQQSARLRRALTAHEMAALLLLAQGAIELSAGTPDFLALHNDGLVDIVESHYSLTETGSAVLYRLVSASQTKHGLTLSLPE